MSKESPLSAYYMPIETVILVTSVSASSLLLEDECLLPLVPESGTFHSCSYTTSRGGTLASRGTGELSATGEG